MASKFNVATTQRNAGLDARYTSGIGSAGTFEIRDGTQPAGPATTATGTVGCTFTMGSPFAAASSGGVLTITLPANVNGVANITPTWGRFKTSGGTAVWDISVGTSGCDLNLTGAIVSGQPVSMTAATIADNNSGH